MRALTTTSNKSKQPQPLLKFFGSPPPRGMLLRSALTGRCISVGGERSTYSQSSDGPELTLAVSGVSVLPEPPGLTQRK